MGYPYNPGGGEEGNGATYLQYRAELINTLMRSGGLSQQDATDKVEEAEEKQGTEHLYRHHVERDAWREKNPEVARALQVLPEVALMDPGFLSPGGLGMGGIIDPSALMFARVQKGFRPGETKAVTEVTPVANAKQLVAIREKQGLLTGRNKFNWQKRDARSVEDIIASIRKSGILYGPDTQSVQTVLSKGGVPAKWFLDILKKMQSGHKGRTEAGEAVLDELREVLKKHPELRKELTVRRTLGEVEPFVSNAHHLDDYGEGLAALVDGGKKPKGMKPFPDEVAMSDATARHTGHKVVFDDPRAEAAARTFHREGVTSNPGLSVKLFYTGPESVLGFAKANGDLLDPITLVRVIEKHVPAKQRKDVFKLLADSIPALAKAGVSKEVIEMIKESK